MRTSTEGREDSGDAWVAALFDNHAASVFRVAYAELKDLQDAQDVVQDTFVVAWRRRRSIHLIDGSALPWLLTTARYISLAHRRRDVRRRTDTIAPEDLHALPANAAQSERTADLIEALAQLPTADRLLVELVLIEGLSYADAASRLGLSVSATGKRLQRARDRLRDTLRPAPRTLPDIERSAT